MKWLYQKPSWVCVYVWYVGDAQLGTVYSGEKKL